MMLMLLLLPKMRNLRIDGTFGGGLAELSEFDPKIPPLKDPLMSQTN